MTKFSQKDNIYLVDQFLCPEKSKMAKKLHNNLYGWAFYKIVTFALTKNLNLLRFPSQKSGQPKSKSPNWQQSQPIRYKANFSLRETMQLLDVKFNITYQNNQGEFMLGHSLDL